MKNTAFHFMSHTEEIQTIRKDKKCFFFKLIMVLVYISLSRISNVQTIIGIKYEYKYNRVMISFQHKKSVLVPSMFRQI